MLKTPLQFVMTQSYSVWANSDISAGEVSNRGFDFEEKAYSLAELRDHIKEHRFCEASESPVTNRSAWLIRRGLPDGEQGLQQNKALHCERILDADGYSLGPLTTERYWKRVVRESIGDDLEPANWKGLDR